MYELKVKSFSSQERISWVRMNRIRPTYAQLLAEEKTGQHIGGNKFELILYII